MTIDTQRLRAHLASRPITSELVQLTEAEVTELLDVYEAAHAWINAPCDHPSCDGIHAYDCASARTERELFAVLKHVTR